MQHHAPVLIAGGGPVGLALAMDLAWRGVRSIVIESRFELQSAPHGCSSRLRAMALAALQRNGGDATRAATLPPDHCNDVVYMTTMNGQELARYRRPLPPGRCISPVANGSGDWPTPERQQLISQLYMEPPLHGQAPDIQGVDLRLGTELRSFAQDADGVSATAHDSASGQQRVIRAGWLVGADGSNSLVRRDIGARLEGIPKISDNVTRSIHAPRLRALYREHPGWMYRLAGGVVVVAIDGADRWMVHVHVPRDEAREGFDPEPRMFAAIGESFAYTVIDETRWTTRAMVTNKFREGRVFLAGDAAHLWVPMGGFGMHSGVGDAASLGWLLAGVYQGWLDRKALEAYGIERSAVAEKVTWQALQWGRDMGRHPPCPAQPHEAASTSSSPSLSTTAAVTEPVTASVAVSVTATKPATATATPGFAHHASPLIAHDGDAAPQRPPQLLDEGEASAAPGTRAPHLWRAGEPAISLNEQFGRGFTLLRIGAEPPAGQALAEAAAQRGIPFTVVVLPEAEAWNKYQGHGLVLVRPDQHVAWRSRIDIDDGTAQRLLDRLTGALIPEPQVRVLKAAPLSSDSTFPEGLRWRRGRLVYADMTGRRVLSLDPKTGVQTVLHAVPHQPNGMAYLPDGRLVIASMLDGQLLATGVGREAATRGLAPYADLSLLARGHLGDMVADSQGGLFVGDIGARVLQGEAPRPGRVIRVDPDGRSRIVLDDVHFPNGMAITPDGQTLLLAETLRNRVLQCHIGPDGGLGPARPYIGFADKGGPDGMAMGPDGSLWVCLPTSRCVEGYDRSGRLFTRIETPAGLAIACALSGDARTLYIAGCRLLRPGSGIFESIAQRSTRGWLASADITSH